ncbi:hypothetical protein RhiJN_05149 [Ceratobasidium sp. AG-Ba]|nr:hypothetical protein RhiJN_05149 [Ceratobasidium sp. AG-Ba]QRW06074.1 hypothetical protein RhiLY_05073 [Ceratobasidium sp. AG-Ba]
MQKSDSAVDEAIMKERTNAAQQAEFAAFQESFSGSAPDTQSVSPLSIDFLNAVHTDNEDESDSEDYNGEEFVADETAAGEDLGLKPPNEGWEKRRQSEHSSWVRQIPALCDAYLLFRSGSVPLDSEPNINNSELSIRCIEMDSESVKIFCIERDKESSINEALVRQGYIGCSPLHPKLAISLKFLELFANIMRRGPSVSVQTLAKASCDSRNHEVPGRHKKNKGKKKADESTESVCEKRWKNAKIHERGDGDKPKTVFRETGIFLSSCRHSFILTFCDMVESGEQAKYGLATIHKLISVFGANIIMGYDIGCSFKKTAARSARLGAWLEEQRFMMCVGAFHGPAHNQLCQFDNHPCNIPGTGLTDFENCETVFSSTNRLAGTTRLASEYHRLQKIDNHIYGYDNDQYLQLGHLLRYKYIDAMSVLEQSELIMGELCPGVSAKDLDRYWQQERQYLESFKSELPEDTFAIEYLSILEKLAAKQAKYDTCAAKNFHFENGPSLSNLHRTALHTSRLENRRRNARDQLMTLRDAVLQMEEDHGITNRWTPESKEWLAAKDLFRRRVFQLCVDELKQLVVLRLLELSKAGLAGTGYKLRQHIMKALIARSVAVKASLARYNQAAQDLYGSAARLFTWEEVSKLSVLAEFELLRDSRRQPLQQEWARPEIRRCIEEWHRAQRAAEEITRLNVEVRRVRTFIADEAALLPGAASKIKAADAGLGWAVEHYVSCRLKVNAIVLRELDLLCELPGFTGRSDRGVRLGLGTHDLPVPPTESAATHPMNTPALSTLIPGVDHTGTPGDADSCESVDHILDEDEDGLSELVARWQLII